MTRLDEHVARLRRSAGGLGIALPADIGERVARGIRDLLAAEALDGPMAMPRSGSRCPAVCTTARSPATRGAATPTIAIQAWPVVPPPAGHLDQIHLAVVGPPRSAEPAGMLKTTSRADYVYARLEARRAGADDALFLTIDGLLSEATSANIFLVRRAEDGGAELATPALDCAILPGTTRSWLLGWAERVGFARSRRSP